MTEQSCDHVRESLTEYALGILPEPDRREVSAHILSCPACRQEMEEMRGIGDRLLDLVPDAEPTLGFERSVLSRIGVRRQDHRRRNRVAAGLLAAAAIVAAIVVPLSVSSDHYGSHPAELTATLRENGRWVGSVDVRGHPLWVYMKIDADRAGGTVKCQLIHPDGTIVTIGTFQLVDGSGSWGAPVPGSMADYSGARLVGPDGSVVAQGTF